MNRLKKNASIIGLSFLFLVALVLNETAKTHFVTIILMSVLTFLAGFHIFKQALMDLRYKIIGIDLLVTIAVVSAFIIGDYFEAAAVTYLFTLGHILEKRSLEKTRSALKSLMDLKPSFARIIKDESETMVPLEVIKQGDILLVKPGEKIPTDGIIIEGTVLIDEQMMTGESMPIEKNVGDEVIGSTILKTGYIKMRTTATLDDTTLSRIIHMVEEAQDKKASTQKFMERFSKYYTPFVVVLAIITFAITWDIRLAITLLVIACPGALVIATPVSYVAGIGNAAKKGILFKGGDSIERLSKGSILFFDKTGTLTQGKPTLQSIISYGDDEAYLLKVASIGESFSEHPLSKAILEAADEKKIVHLETPKELKMVIGKGITFEYNKDKFAIGNKALMTFIIPRYVEEDIQKLEELGITTLILSRNDQIIGLFGIADGIRQESKNTIQKIKKYGFKKSIMLTGDQERVAKHIAFELGLDAYYAGLLPEEKATIIQSYRQEKYHTVFVGDGINDALAFIEADASVAIGGLGKDLAMETADVVLIGERIEKLVDAIKISKKVRLNMIENIGFALFVVLILMVGVLFNWVTMSIGMLIHELSVLIVLMNAIRLLRYDLRGVYGKRLRTKQLHKGSTHI